MAKKGVGMVLDDEEIMELVDGGADDYEFVRLRR